MKVMATTSTSQFGQFYGESMAASDLRRYQRKGPRPWTRTLLKALITEGVEGATLLDIGGGIGAIQHELLAAGVSHATGVDASAPYLAAAQEESIRRGDASRTTFLHGDFVELAESVPPADIVTLDRVLNVYPEWERLAALSAQHARRLYGLVYPRDRRSVRFVIFLMNLVLRLRRQPIRARVHPPEAIGRIASDNGLRLHVSQAVGPVWQVSIYRRI